MESISKITPDFKIGYHSIQWKYSLSFYAVSLRWLFVLGIFYTTLQKCNERFIFFRSDNFIFVLGNHHKQFSYKPPNAFTCYLCKVNYVFHDHNDNPGMDLRHLIIIRIKMSKILAVVLLLEIYNTSVTEIAHPLIKLKAM